MKVIVPVHMPTGLSHSVTPFKIIIYLPWIKLSGNLFCFKRKGAESSRTWFNIEWVRSQAGSESWLGLVATKHQAQFEDKRKWCPAELQYCTLHVLPVAVRVLFPFSSSSHSPETCTKSRVGLIGYSKLVIGVKVPPYLRLAVNRQCSGCNLLTRPCTG